MNIEHLYTFQEVVRLGSFSEVAKKLGISQPAVSFQIQKLEQELGIRLIDRSQRAIIPTTAGKRLPQFAESVEIERDSLQHDLYSDGRISLFKFHQERRQQVLAGDSAGGDAQLPVDFLAHLFQVVLEVRALLLNRLGEAEETLAGGCQGNRPLGTVNQAYTEFMFQFLNLERHCWLADGQLFGYFGKAAEPDYLLECLEMV